MDCTPSVQEQIRLIEETGLTRRQIVGWFNYQRKKLEDEPSSRTVERVSKGWREGRRLIVMYSEQLVRILPLKGEIFYLIRV